MKCAPFALCFVLFAASGFLASQDPQEPPRVMSTQPLSAEQLTVYRTALRGWMGKHKAAINLADRTTPDAPSRRE